MRKTKGLLLAVVVITLCLGCHELYHEHADISSAKSMVLVYKSQPVHVHDELVDLAGPEGSIDWNNTEICTSGDQHVSEVEAVVEYKDPKGQTNTATYYFHVNHDSRRIHLDYFAKNGKAEDVKEGISLIIPENNSTDGKS